MRLSQSACPCSREGSSRGQGKIAHAPAVLCHQSLGGAALPGARIADIDPLADDVLERLDATVGADQDGEGFGVQREHRAQFGVGPLLREEVGAAISVMLPVGLCDPEVHFAGRDGVQVEDGTAGALGVAAHAVRGLIAVDQPADVLPRRVVHAGDAPRADGDEALVGAGRQYQGQRERGPRDQPNAHSDE
jgi:hypothetical protein